MVASVASSTSAQASSVSGNGTTAAELNDRFLTLLTTQMKNQDPLNPMDNAQVTSQMAQVSTLSGIEKLNSTLSAYTEAQSFQAAGMIGHTVVAPGNSIALSGGAAAAGVEVPSAVDSLKVTIYNGKDVAVRTLDLGKQSEAGMVPFSWDGKDDSGNTVADGAYTFSSAAKADGKVVQGTNLSLGMVSSVMLSGGVSTLKVTGLGDVAMSAVRQIL